MKPRTPEQSFRINVPLRGNRDYLHSTNLFDFLVARTRAHRNLMLMFRRKITCEVQACPATQGRDPQSYPARFIGEGNDGRTDLFLTEAHPLTPLGQREPYNEDAVAAGSRIEGNAILSDEHNGASAIERMVALNKRLLSSIVQERRVLVFSKISLASLPDRKARLKVMLLSRLGMTLFRSRIFVNETEFGEIVFYGT
jgi:hypothetical protein